MIISIVNYAEVAPQNDKHRKFPTYANFEFKIYVTVYFQVLCLILIYGDMLLALYSFV